MKPSFWSFQTKNTLSTEACKYHEAALIWAEYNVLFVGKYNSDLVRSNIWSLFFKQLHNIITLESLQNFFLK